jgi:hypothetical protein
VARGNSLVFVINMPDFDEHYRSMTDDELLSVARDSRYLTPEARNSLNGELSRRRITSAEVNKYEHEQSNDSSDKKFNSDAAYSLWPSLRRLRETIRDWKQYRHQTGMAVSLDWVLFSVPCGGTRGLGAPRLVQRGAWLV